MNRYRWVQEKQEIPTVPIFSERAGVYKGNTGINFEFSNVMDSRETITAGAVPAEVETPVNVGDRVSFNGNGEFQVTREGQVIAGTVIGIMADGQAQTALANGQIIVSRVLDNNS